MSFERQAPFFRDIYNGMSTWGAFGNYAPAEKFDIGMLQKMLKFCGEKDDINSMKNLTVDGVMGPSTETAIKAYQDFANIRDLITAYGRFDACTSYYLNNRVNYLGGLPGYNPGSIIQDYVKQEYWHGTISPTQIVIHWTAEGATTSTAKKLRDNFNNGATSGNGAHFYIDDHETIQTAPTNQKLYHCNNENGISIGIEMCVNAGGNWFEVERVTVNLVKQLKSEYSITTIKKHSACSGASTVCPYPYNGDNRYWQSLLSKCS